MNDLRRLYLMRHGIANSSAVDSTEGLSFEGLKEVEKVAHFLAQSNQAVDLILHSEKKRAKQTAEFMAGALNTSSQGAEGLKPNDPVAPWVSHVLAENTSLMIVSHLPFLESLLSTLVFGNELYTFVSFSPASVVCIEPDLTKWKISWMIQPSMLP